MRELESCCGLLVPPYPPLPFRCMLVLSVFALLASSWICLEVSSLCVCNVLLTRCRRYSSTPCMN